MKEFDVRTVEAPGYAKDFRTLGHHPMQRMTWYVFGAAVIALALFAYSTLRDPSSSFLRGNDESNSASPSPSSISQPRQTTNARPAKGPYRSDNKIAKLPGTPDTPLIEQLAALEQQARTGDPDIGLALGVALKTCLELDGKYSDLESRLALHPDRAESIAVHADMLDVNAEYCKGLPSDTLDKYGDWIELAAQRGSVGAQLAYSTIFAELLSQDHALDTPWIERYKSNSLGFLESAANSGSVDALGQLAYAYKDGLLVNGDARTAYAYQFAVAQSGLVGSSQRVLDLWARDLTPEELASAQARGAEIYRNCCQ